MEEKTELKIGDKVSWRGVIPYIKYTGRVISFDDETAVVYIDDGYEEPDCVEFISISELELVADLEREAEDGGMIDKPQVTNYCPMCLGYVARIAELEAACEQLRRDDAEASQRAHRLEARWEKLGEVIRLIMSDEARTPSEKNAVMFVWGKMKALEAIG